MSHTTLAFDRGLKAQLYSCYGAREYWVIDVVRRRTNVHRGPRPDGAWMTIETSAEDVPLAHPTVPGFSLGVSDL